MYDTPWRSVCDHCAFLPAKSRLLQVFIVFIVAMGALSDVPTSGTPETFVQLTITPNQLQNYTLKTDNTNELKLRMKVPSNDCIGSVTFRSNFILIPGAPAGTNCEALEFVWRNNGNRFELVIRGYESGRSITYDVDYYNVNMDGVYAFNSTLRNINFNSYGSLTFPCKLNFLGGVDGLPNYFALTVESKGFPDSCNMEIALLGVEKYDPPTTTTTTIAPEPTEPGPDEGDGTNTTPFENTSENPTIYPSPEWWSNFWLVIGLIIALVVLVFLIIGYIAYRIYFYVKEKRQAKDNSRRREITRGDILKYKPTKLMTDSYYYSVDDPKNSKDKKIDQQEDAVEKDLPLEATEESESGSVKRSEQNIEKAQYESDIPPKSSPSGPTSNEAGSSLSSKTKKVEAV